MMIDREPARLENGILLSMSPLELVKQIWMAGGFTRVWKDQLNIQESGKS